MLLKFFGGWKHKPRQEGQVPPIPNPSPAREKSSALKIIHVGGVVERYYMAVPAARIMEKHPNFILAKPEVFRRPWESAVKPEEILIPGQKFFIVPTQTLNKLRRRMRKPSGEYAASSVASESSVDVSTEIVSQEKGARSGKSLLRKGINLTKPKSKIVVLSHHVRLGVKSKKDSGSVSMGKKGNAEAGVKKSSISTKSSGGKKVKFSVTWEPSLTAIDESHCSDD